MRKEASLEQWGTLYETATRIKELKPWEKFWDMDLIGVRRGAEEETVFFSILGRGGNCYGISVYEGYEGFNTYLMLTMKDSLNLSPEYAMFHQKNLTCYWGDREELTNKQRKTIKDLGYSYRGKNQWLYFLSFMPGYYPYNLDEEEVLRMSEHLQDLELAIQNYNEDTAKVNFEEGNMFLLSFGEDKKTWEFREEALPFTDFQFWELMITDENLLADLGKVPKCSAVLEADVSVMGASVKDKKYSRPANPMLSVLGDAESEVVINFEMSMPGDDPIITLADIVVDFIFQYGAPREIRVSNMIIQAALTQICDVCEIELRSVRRLKGLDSFMQGLERFNR